MKQSPHSTAAMQWHNLRKSYGKQHAVDSISLTIPTGSFFGFVGPNGAGKTTSLSMAVGLLRPDNGSVSVFGYDVWSNPFAAKKLIGVLPDGLSMPERLTGREVLLYLGLLHGLDEKTIKQRSDELLDVLDFKDDENKLIISYSTGMRKKIGLATALLHAPKLLVLDEPFEAVDPVSAATIKNILIRFVDGGGTVILSSHVMQLVEQLCTDIAVIAKGKIVASGSLKEIQNGKSLEEQFIRLVGTAHTGKEGLSWLAS